MFLSHPSPPRAARTRDAMAMLIRHLLAVLALPVTVAAWVPWSIARRYRIGLDAPAAPLELLSCLVGAGLLLAGAALFLACVLRFGGEGKGTLAPWDPPRRLVLGGPYRFVRNPMISGVILTLFGEAAVLRSGPHAIWAVAFLLLNLLYIPLFEEPQLENRFGDDYRRYKANVPRIVPRLRPWRGDAGGRDRA